MTHGLISQGPWHLVFLGEPSGLSLTKCTVKAWSHVTLQGCVDRNPHLIALKTPIERAPSLTAIWNVASKAGASMRGTGYYWASWLPDRVQASGADSFNTEALCIIPFRDESVSPPKLDPEIIPQFYLQHATFGHSD